jgi:HK97 family phage portal protein
MGLFDWLGPLNVGSKRRGWDQLPAPVAEQKAGPSWLIDDYRAVVVSPLIHGPGATDLLANQYGSAANSAVFACLQVIATAIAEPELKLYRVAATERVEVDAAPIVDLLRRPNPHMTLDTLLWYLSNCLKVDGNAYWRKLRAGNDLTGNVVELWPISPSRIKPTTAQDSGDFITAYRYYVRPGQYEVIDPANIVHFKTGLDDRDHRLGCAPLKRLAREVSSDDQATRYADRLLANLAINGLSVEWDKDTQPIDKATADEIKARIQSAYGGDNVGAVSVLSPGAKLVSHGFSPEQMDLKVLHRVPEERIAAVLGVPAIVAGLGAGLDRSTYSNFSEAREAFTEMTLIPTWRSIAAEMTLQLLPDFTSNRSDVVDFDISEVRALSDDQNALAVRLQTYVAAGILTVDEARAEIGREPKATDVANPPPALPESRSRPRIVTLPHRSIKAPDDLPGQFSGLKDDLDSTWQSEIESFLAAQLRRVNARLRAGGDTAEDLVAEGEAVLLGETLVPLQTALLDDVTRLVVAELGIAFDLDDPATRAYLRSAGSNIVGITETTRDQVRAALLEGQAAGEGIPQLAARLEQLPAFNRARAITRTELGHSTNLASIAGYRASGVVVGCTVFDGDYDAACQSMNGRKFRLDQLPPTLQHPRCLRAFAPIVDESELERSA